MGERIRRPALAILGFLVAVSVVALPGAGAIELPRAFEDPIANPALDDPSANPDLERSCGLNILVILDESSSIEISGATDDVRTAFKAFTGALKNTASSMAVADFGTVATLPAIGAFPPGEYITITDATQVDLDAYIDNDYDPPHGPPYQYTGWEDALRMGNPNFAPRPDPTVPHLTVFITDGEPNRIIKDSVSTDDYENQVPLRTSFPSQINSADEDTSAQKAVANANGLKQQGSHILAIAVGDGLTSPASIDRLELVSGPDIYDGTGEFDIVTDDIYLEPDFDQLADALREAAFQLCAPSITIQKLIDDTPDPDSLDDAYPGVDWEIDGTASATGGYEWVLPSTGTGPSTKTAFTNGAGFATFQWNTNTAVDSGFTATEVVQTGYTNDQSRTACTFRTPDTPDADLPLDSIGDGTFSATIPTESIVTCTLVNVLGPNPGITIEKHTNGFDADVATGPLIPASDVVEWSYIVTNTGNTILSDISVTDVELIPASATGPTVSCPQTTLVQGESMTCTAIGVSGTLASGDTFIGQYGNEATVTAVDSLGAPVADVDPSHYFVTQPGVSVEKSTNGVDADLAPGPFVGVGSTVDWQYVMTNTGSVLLTDVTLVDSVIGDVIGNPDAICVWPIGESGRLPAGESAICDLPGIAIEGQYENIATVTGLDPDESTVSDTDPSHYFGAVPGIDIEKATQGQDADLPYPDPDVPVVEIGSTVSWTYVVTNTGNVPLASWDVTDDQGVSVACPRIVLVPGASATCNATGIAAEGEYANVGTATATDPLGGEDLVATDPSHYFAPTEDITIEKFTNGEDADSATGPFVPLGDPVDWTYRVTNTGTSTLTDVVVFDSDFAEITDSCVAEGESPPWDQELTPGESADCLVSGSAEVDQYTNIGVAIGTGPFNDVGWLDPSNYFGTESDIIINKYTNGSDADAAPGIYVPVGDPIEWTYNVANVGNNALSAIAVTDNLEGDISCGFTTLAVGEQGVCTLDGGPAILGQYSNVGSVTAIDSAENPLSDDDPSNYFGYLSTIDVEKATNGEDADTGTGPMVHVGDPVTWTYVVTNPGNVALSDIVMDDDRGVLPVFVDGDDNFDLLLDPDEAWTFEASGIAVEGQYENLATVIGRDLFRDDFSASDPSHYIGIVSEIAIEKATNGEDADTLPGPTIESGEPVVWTYVVTNPGTVPLANVTVTDDQGEVPAYVDGDTNDDDLLDPGETWTYEASGTAVAGQYANVATATGTDPLDLVVEATDPSHYLGYGAGIDIEKATNGDDADVAPGVEIAVGAPVAWTYVVTNTGDVALSDIVLVDDQGVVPSFVGGDTDGDGLLDTDETWTFEASGTAVLDQYTNLGTVSGIVTEPDGPVVDAPRSRAVGDTISAEDPSNYFGFLAGIDVEKSTNGVDADTAPGVEILVGDSVTWTYVVTNTGDSPIAEVALVDDRGELPVFIGGDTNGDTLLDPDEIWTYEAKGTAVAGQYTNVATATGSDLAGGTVTDEDPSNYNGVSHGLPVTGIETAALGLIGLLLLGAGAVLIGLTRSKKRKQGSTVAQ
ncbi:MAG: hypothetical protein M3092_04620 [Actinomycetia bacterium]|nr:hypothetical protein [Actinomycetes bacterium]